MELRTRPLKNAAGCWSRPVFCLTRLAFTPLPHTNGCLCLWPQFPFIIIVLVKDLNDNPPVFQQMVYKLNVSEVGNRSDPYKKRPFFMNRCIFGATTFVLQLSPENTVVGRVEAKDLDKFPLYYRLEGETVGLLFFCPTYRTEQKNQSCRPEPQTGQKTLVLGESVCLVFIFAARL